MDITADTFEIGVVERSKEIPVIVCFWAGWYRPCRELRPVLESEIGERQGRIELVDVDVEAEPALAARHRIQSIPTVVVFSGGRLVTGFMGVQPAAFVGTFLDDVIAAHAAATPGTSSGTRSITAKGAPS